MHEYYSYDRKYVRILLPGTDRERGERKDAVSKKFGMTVTMLVGEMMKKANESRCSVCNGSDVTATVVWVT